MTVAYMYKPGDKVIVQDGSEIEYYVGSTKGMWLVCLSANCFAVVTGVIVNDS